MDIFVTNLPIQTTEKQLRDFFQTHLNALNIHVFNCQKFLNKGQAVITVCDSIAGTEFLRLYGSSRHRPSITVLTFLGKRVFCTRSNRLPDPLLVKCLIRQENQRIKAAKSGASKADAAGDMKEPRRFRFQTLWNGFWEYRASNLVFHPTYMDNRGGSVGLGDNFFVILIDIGTGNNRTIRLDIPYHSIESMVTGGAKAAALTLTLTQAPMMTEINDESMEPSLDAANTMPTQNLLTAMLAALNLGTQAKKKITRKRLYHIDPLHEKPGMCFVYRIEASHEELQKLEKAVRAISAIPHAIRVPTSMKSRITPIKTEFQELISSLRDINQYGSLPFQAKFQIQGLAQSGFLSPRTVARLLPNIKLLLEEFNVVAVAEAIRNLLNTSNYVGPHNDYEDFTIDALIQKIRDYARSFTLRGSMYSTASRHQHVGIVHRAMITPTGVHLDGPDLETKNRVLRKYPQHTEYFLRVTFTEEDGQQVRRDHHVDSSLIFTDRFKKKLEVGIDIAGRIYAFLGFSHSSLRCQQCWFMAPFVYEGHLIHAQEVIKGLGDFSSFRSPAKCAARIGQAFSDTTDAIPMPLKAITTIPDIERNQRVFSDGVGCISQQLLQKVWSNFSRTRRTHPTILQVRFKGAKGVLALNSQLGGEQLCLRPSMTKFEGSESLDLEICGAASKPLRMHLNRQFVKILEDLGVPPESFVALQQAALDKLRAMTASPTNAAFFLETSHVGTGARTPHLIRRLDDLGLDFRDDSFLRQVPEIAALIQLRDIKHRARIPVENAFTLYGVIDETGYLKEGEIHVAIRNDKGQRKVLEKEKVVITRAPALHPGDVQFAKAVDVPAGNPCSKLHNCVIFSQQGDRDLPSQLSGGDLDGDIFNVIYESTLFPKETVTAAEYPRPTPIDIKRPVTASDICDFFITFMQNDQLGHVCNTHMQVADQKVDGTLNPSCIVLAEMASTAVDFSKTGIPVNMCLMPTDYSRRFKPDFMADGPRLILAQNLVLKDQIEAELFEDYDADQVYAINPAPSKVKYYKSEKILGRLYRAIDETKFLEEMEAQHCQYIQPSGTNSPSLMRQVWNYVERETRLVEWHQHKHVAREIRALYESELVQIMDRYSPHPRHMLTELEVFSGTILGKDGSLPNKRIRETNKDMKERFDRGVGDVIAWIEHGAIGEEGEDYHNDDSIADASEGLARAIACFHLAMTEQGTMVRRSGGRREGKEVTSFAYVAAAICLQEVERFQGLGYLRPL